MKRKIRKSNANIFSGLAIGLAVVLLLTNSQRAVAQSNTFPSTGNVGIGTTSPLQKLQIGTNSSTSTATPDSISLGASYSNTAGANLKLRLYDDNAGTIYGLGISNAQLDYRAGTGGDHVFYQNTTETMRIKGTGNVGIGTASPDTNAKLHIYNAPGAGMDIQSATAGAWSRIRLVTGTHAYGWFAGDSTQPDAPNKIGLYDYTTGAFRMMVDSSGNVGIGTSTPATKLHVAGDTTVTGNINVSGTGNINATGTITGGNIVAKYQDVAEWVESSQTLAAGTVVVLDHTKSNQVVASSQAYDTRVAGVISLQPGIALGEKGESKVLVATTGRVKVKVDATSGPIQVGDLLVTGDKPGVAIKSQPVNIGGVQLHRPGTLIGKALEPLATGTGEILVLLSLQ
jgi:hypothetical protein